MGKPSALAADLLRGLVEGNEPTVEAAHALAWSVLGAAPSDVRLALEVLAGGELTAARLTELIRVALAQAVDGATGAAATSAGRETSGDTDATAPETR